MKKTLLATLLAVACLQARGQLIINELMQSNIDCLMDDLNEFPDSWVELYNSGEEAVNLNQYKLGDEDDATKAWQLPYRMLDPKQYIVIYCDKEAKGLHTDFRLESGKNAAAYLFQGENCIDKVEKLKKQPAPNIAYGRKTEGEDKWGYQAVPTPGAANCGKLYKDILGQPVFSQKGCVMSSGESVTLTISLPEDAPEGTVVRYTTTGAEPTVKSAEFKNELTLSSNTVIRAKLFCDGYLSPRSTVQSYLFFPTNRPLTLPVISIVTDNRYFNDPTIGILYFDQNKANDDRTQNYFYDWRRPINFEYFEGQNTKSLLNQLCETRVQGGATRTNPLKSLAIYANKRFGEKRFKYEFFPDQKPGLTDFKSLVLRNSGNDFDYLYNRDAVIQRSVAQHVDLDWQAWRPAIVYINGVYKGMLNIRERANEDNVYTNHLDAEGDGLEDIDMFENWDELKEGTWDNYNAFKDFYAEYNHTLAEYAEWMDWEEFFNLMIMNLFFDNEDFPCNNIVMWRPRAEGGKWRWIAKDTDFGLGLYGAQASYNTIAWVNEHGYDNNHNSWGNDWPGTRLFRRMMEDPDLKREFIDRCAIYMGDFLNEKGVRAIWDPMYDMIKTEYPYHRKLYNEWWPNYNDVLNEARNWLAQRNAYFTEHLKNYYQLGNIIPMTVNTNLAADDLACVEITFNGVKLSEGKFDGNFFAGRKVTLKATPVNGKQVTKWTIWKRKSDNTGSSRTVVNGAECSFDIPADCPGVTVNATLADATGIESVSIQQSSITTSHYYTLDGRRVEHPTKGIYIHEGKKVVVK